MAHRTAQQLLRELSWGLLGGVSKRPYKCLGGVTDATLASASAYTHYHGPPLKSAKNARPQTTWANNWRYYVEHRRHIGQVLPRHHWLIVSRSAVVLHHPDQNLVFEALRRHYWPGAIMVRAGAPAAIANRSDDRLVVVAPDRPGEQPRLAERASFFANHPELMDIMACINAAAMIEPLVYCEMPTDEGLFTGVRWEQLAAVFRRDGRYVALMTDQLQYLYEFEGNDYDCNEEKDMYGLCALARHIDDAVQEEIQYERNHLLPFRVEKLPVNE
jgi:hypothetical protein